MKTYEQRAADFLKATRGAPTVLDVAKLIQGVDIKEQVRIRELVCKTCAKAIRPGVQS